jgi:hypothetical protein
MAKQVKSAAAQNAAWLAAMQAPAAAANYKSGIQATTENPMAKAASPTAQARYLNSVTAAVQSGRMAAKLNAVPMQYWQSQAMNMGSMNLASGARKGSAKQLAAAQRLQSVQQAASDAAAAIPSDGTAATAIAKFTASLQVMMAAKGK